MRVMFCNFNMFDMNSQVLAVAEDAEPWPLFTGTFEDVCNFMAAEYRTNEYEKIVLAGPYAEVVEDRVRTYSKVNYGNTEDIKFEVINV